VWETIPVVAPNDAAYTFATPHDTTRTVSETGQPCASLGDGRTHTFWGDGTERTFELSLGTGGTMFPGTRTNPHPTPEGTHQNPPGLTPANNARRAAKRVEKIARNAAEATAASPSF
jgi:hypothetical protein